MGGVGEYIRAAQQLLLDARVVRGGIERVLHRVRHETDGVAGTNLLLKVSDGVINLGQVRQEDRATLFDDARGSKAGNCFGEKAVRPAFTCPTRLM